MTARLSHGSPDDAHRPSSLGLDTPPSPATSRPVLSVSPDAVNRAVPAEPDEDASSRAFLSPRVLDQSTVEELAASLRGLIEEAGRASTTLDERLQAADQAGADTTGASMQLQERLRLGARMLKAFQTQIARVETSLREVEEREQRLDAMEQRIHTALERLEARSTEAANEVEREMERVKCDGVTRLQQELAPVLEQVESTTSRLDESIRRTIAVDEAVDAAEVGLAALSARAAEASVAIDERLERSAPLLERGEDLHAKLEAMINQAPELLDRLEGRHRTIAQEMEDHVLRAGTLEQSIAGRLEEAATGATRLDEAITAGRGLQEILRELRPWHPLLAAMRDGGLPEPVERVVASLRLGLGRDLSHVAGTLRSAADRMEQLGAGRPERPVLRAAAVDAAQSSRMPDIITLVDAPTVPAPSGSSADT